MTTSQRIIKTISTFSLAARVMITSTVLSAGAFALAPIGAGMATFEAIPQAVIAAFPAAPAPLNQLPMAAVTRELSEQEVLLQVCEARGYGEECAKALLGMMWKESLNDGRAIGDAGKARGYFQIHYRLHKVDIACAENLRCSAEWSLRYLERNGYPQRVAHAVQCHNGCYAPNGYAASAMRHGERLWDKPVPKPVHRLALAD